MFNQSQSSAHPDPLYTNHNTEKTLITQSHSSGHTDPLLYTNHKIEKTLLSKSHSRAYNPLTPGVMLECLNKILHIYFYKYIYERAYLSWIH